MTSPRPATSCAGCFAWGVLSGRYCHACFTFRRQHAVGTCSGCRREQPLKTNYCRLCWTQASLDARGHVSVLAPFLRTVGHHQLFFTGMHRIRQPGVRIGKQGRRGLRPRPQPAPVEPIPAWSQPRLVDAPRDFTRFDRRLHADLTNPWLSEGHRIAADLGERRGWTRGVRHEVDRALVVALSTHATGDQVRYSELFRALRARRLSVERTVEVLDLLGVLDDDRTPAVDLWLDRNLADVSAGIRHDVEAWLRMLRDGGPRSRPRAPQTAWTCLNAAQPVLVEWSARYQHLREVTRDDVLAVAAARHGNDRHYTLSVLRSLFRHCAKTGTIFRDPAARVPVGRHDYSLALPLPAEQLQAVAAAAVTPVVRVAIALAAIHAARPNAIRRLHVDDIDLGNRRLTVAGRSRPLDDLTRHVLLDWLDYRRARWPDTANPHALITQQTANETGPVSPAWMARTFGGLGSTLEQLRVDRQLDEALTRGPGPAAPGRRVRHRRQDRGPLRQQRAAAPDDGLRDVARRGFPATRGPYPHQRTLRGTGSERRPFSSRELRDLKAQCSRT